MLDSLMVCNVKVNMKKLQMMHENLQIFANSMVLSTVPFHLVMYKIYTVAFFDYH